MSLYQLKPCKLCGLIARATDASTTQIRVSAAAVLANDQMVVPAAGLPADDGVLVPVLQ